MKTTRDELEGRLTTMFQRQAEEVPVPDLEWRDVGRARVLGPVRTPRRRSFALAAVALVPLVVAVALVTTRDGGERERVRTQTPAAQGTDAPDPATPAPAGAPFQAETKQVSLSADAVSIDAGGQTFVTAAPIEVHSDPGTPNEYTTLELTWREHGVEMRVNIYFKSDGNDWWSDEIRTYNGSAQGDWITYKGDFFRSPLGTPFTSPQFDVGVTHPASGLRLTNLQLEAFRRPAACTNPTAPFALEPGTSRIEMAPVTGAGTGVQVGGYGVGVTLLDTASCAPVANQDTYRYEWRAQDPAALTVRGTGRRADLEATGHATTSLLVTAKDPGSGAVVAESTIAVVVGGSK